MIKYVLTLTFLLSFILGTCAGYSGYSAIYPMIAICVSGLSFFALKKYFHNVAGFILVLSIGILAGQLYYHAHRNIVLFSYRIPWDQKMEAECLVVSEPKTGDSGQSYLCELAKPYSGRIRVLSAAAPEIKMDQNLKLALTVRRPDNHDALPVAFYPRVISQGIEKHSSWIGTLVSIKEKCLGIFKRVLPQEESALMSGLLFGYTGDFSEALKNCMRRSGMIHIVALSGFNITILVYITGSLIRWPKFSRLGRFAGLIIILGIFLGMVGYSSSVARAAVMGLIFALARFSGRLSDFYLPVAWSAFFLTLADPSAPMSDLGFQLSFLSLLGVSSVTPALSGLLGWQDKTSLLNWRENILATAGAQIAVLPILISSFGSLSAWAILTNVLILELVPWLMLAGAILAVSGFISIYLAGILASPVYLGLWYVVNIIKVFGSGVGQIYLSSGSYSWIFFYYAAVIMFVLYVKIKNVSGFHKNA